MAHIRLPHTTFGILHPEGCKSALQGWDASGWLIRNALPSGWASGCSAFSILLVSKGAVQGGYAAGAPEAAEEIISLYQG